uniref:PH domain-containing protein n=1 Tax=Romanomermis culicivorax TaxID=13658 RepID=A0A915I5M3_ROMCU
MQRQKPTIFLQIEQTNPRSKYDIGDFEELESWLFTISVLHSPPAAIISRPILNSKIFYSQEQSAMTEFVRIKGKTWDSANCDV